MSKWKKQRPGHKLVPVVDTEGNPVLDQFGEQLFEKQPNRALRRFQENIMRIAARRVFGRQYTPPKGLK